MNFRYLAASLLGIIILASLAFVPTKFSDNPFLTNLRSRLAVHKSTLPVEKAYLQFDRPFFEPGEEIWFKAWLADGNTLQASGVSQVLYVELLDPKGNVSQSLKLIAMNGTARGSFQLKGQAPGGVYSVRAYTQWAQGGEHKYLFEKELTVQAVTLPNLRMKLDFAREAYGPGDEVLAELKLEDLANRPLAGSSFKYVIQLQGQTISTGNGNARSDGTADIRFQLPATLESSDGLLNVQIPYQGLTESISRSVPIVLNNIDLQFFPEGGELVVGVPGRVAFKALDEFGKPADVEGEIIGSWGGVVARFSSFHQGMGAFNFTPTSGAQYQVRLTKPVERVQKVLFPKAKKVGYALSTAVKENRVDVSFYNPGNKHVSVLAQMHGEPLFSSELAGMKGSTSFSIPTHEMPIGVLQVTLFDHRGMEQCERLVFVNRERELNIVLTTDKEKYLPREKVTLNLEVSDGAGNPTAANLALAVVDDKLLSFADDKSDNILSHLLLSSEVTGTVEEPNFYFDEKEPKAAEALDYLLMTQGWRRFDWANWQQQTVQDWAQAAESRHAEKAIVSGRVRRFHNKDVVGNIAVTVVETGEVAYTDSTGLFQFENLDLSHPRNLKAVTPEGRTINVQVNNYSKEYKLGGQLEGFVYDKASGEPIPFATVVLKGTSIGANTDLNGHFRLPTTSETSDHLVVSYIGYSSLDVPLDGQISYNIGLEENQVQLQGVEIRAEQVRHVRKLNNVQMLAAPQRNAVQVAAFKKPKKKVKEKRVQAPPPPPAQAIEVAEVEKDLGRADFAIADLEVVVANEANMAFAADVAVADFGAVIPAEEILYQKYFYVAQTMPQHPEGDKGLYDELRDLIEYPQLALESGVEGKVFVQFTVNKEGKVEAPTVLRGIGHGCDEAALTAVRQLSGFTPGEQAGKKVPVRMTLPISFSDPKRIEIELVAPDVKFLRGKPSAYHAPREFYSPLYQKQEEVKLRNDFRKTVYWNPEVRTGPNGKATVSFFNNDEVSTFRATAEGLSVNGLPGRKEHTFYSQLPVTTSFRLPPYLTYEDQISLPITVANNTGESISGEMFITVPASMQAVNGKDKFSFSLKARQSRTYFVDYVVGGPAGPGKVLVKMDCKGLSDEQERSFVVLPKGFPANASFGGGKMTTTRNLTIRSRVEGSMTASVSAYPSLITEVMSGVESLLREPGGCFEQTSRSAYPNVLALQYLNETNSASPEVRKKAEGMIQRGYDKLISFETKEKGYEWFGGVPAHEGLTAYGLMEFVDMKEVYASVDDDMIQRTSKWIAKRKDGKGGFKLNSKALDSFGRASKEVTNAYVVYALSEAGYTDVELELNSANKSAMSSKDAYQLACVANAWFNMNVPVNGKKALDVILDKGPDTDFSALNADHSITRSTAQNLEIETVSLVILAMLKSPTEYYATLPNAVKHLLTLRSNGGRFGSTQGTVLALKALTQFAKFNKKTPESGKFEVYIDGKLVGNKTYQAGDRGELKIDGLEAFLNEGDHTIEVRFADTKQALPIAFTSDWNTRVPNNSPDCVVGLKTSLNAQKCEMGETVRMTVELSNQSKQGQPMTVATVGIPSGLSLQPWQLKQLMERNVVDFYEIHNQYLVLYYRDMSPKEKHTIELDLKAEVPGSYEAPAASAYLYYTDELKTWAPGPAILIRSPQ